MNSARKGNGREVRSANILTSEGWIVGSRRHIAGPGDLLANKPGERGRLIEVKATLTPYAHFGKADRIALREYAKLFGLVPELAYWAPGAKTHEIVDETSWPD